MRNVGTLVTAVEKFIWDEVLPIDDEYDGDVEAAGHSAVKALTAQQPGEAV